MNNTYVIVLASGSGERISSHVPKQFLKVAGRTLVEHTLEVFERHPRVDEIILVVHPQYRNLMEEILLRNRFSKVRRLLNGGRSRQESSAIGVAAIGSQDGVVLIHDAVRPFVSERIISDCLDALLENDAVDTAIPATDTIVQVGADGLVHSVPRRQELMRGQTPQGFRLQAIREAHRRAAAEGYADVTDDCALVLKYGLAPIRVVRGDENNIKVTYAGDVFLADRLFQLRAVSIPEGVDLARLAGKVIVVFGASRGIGECVLRLASANGAKAYGFSRASGGDVTRSADVMARLDEVAGKEGRIDAVLVSAGWLGMGRIAERSPADIDREIAVNFQGPVNVARAAVPHLASSRGSLLFYTSSSYTRGRSLYSIYSATKAAVVNFTQAIAEELAAQGIRVNVMNPERTRTPMRMENFGAEPEGSLLEPEAVAEASLKALLTDLTGQVIDVRRSKTS
jgi:ribitol-5-phosphate 2-dehydrogenase (NADP+) / D-ribitol-5-phosphate cytidylyltransferase